MKIFVQISKEKRLLGWGSTRGSAEDFELEVSPEHEVVRNPFIFCLHDGQLVKDVDYQQLRIKEKQHRRSLPTTEQKLEMVQNVLDDLILGGML